MHTRRNKTNPPKGRNAEMFKNKSNKNNKRLKQSTRVRKIFVFDSQGVFTNDFIFNFLIFNNYLIEKLNLGGFRLNVEAIYIVLLIIQVIVPS